MTPACIGSCRQGRDYCLTPESCGLLNQRDGGEQFEDGAGEFCCARALSSWPRWLASAVAAIVFIALLIAWATYRISTAH